jgi:hypothetical protein
MAMIPRLSLIVLWFCAGSVLAQTQDVSQEKHPRSSLELRSSAQITPEDSQLVTSRARDIARSAEFYGYTLDGSWNYQQTVCPVARNHVLLNYSRTEPNGSTSTFSAVVPRQGRVVEIFPIVRSGFAPYVQPWGEHSYTVFNSLISDERKGAKKLDTSDTLSVPWKDWALCYVALVTTPTPNSMAPFRLASEITISFPDRGVAIVGFTAGDGELSYSDWTLTFTPKGLVKATREQHEVVVAPGISKDIPLPSEKGETGSKPPQPQPDTH